MMSIGFMALCVIVSAAVITKFRKEHSVGYAPVPDNDEESLHESE